MPPLPTPTGSVFLIRISQDGEKARKDTPMAKPIAKTITALKPTTPTPAALGRSAVPAARTPEQRPGAKVELKPHNGQPSHQVIAEAAYFRWLQRGGNPTENWLEAEAELQSHLG
jgi:hypothetical protein